MDAVKLRVLEAEIEAQLSKIDQVGVHGAGRSRCRSDAPGNIFAD